MQIRRKYALLFCLLLLGTGLLKAQITFTMSDQTLPCETASTCIDVTVTNFDEVRSMQFAIRWDTSHFSYQTHSHTFPVSNPPLFNLAETSLGYLPLVWFFNGPAGTGYTLPDNSTIITLCLDIVGVPDTHDIRFTPQRGSIIEVTDVANGNNANFLFEDAQIILTDNEDPMLVCPPDTTVFTNIVNNIQPTTLSDNCGLDSVLYSFSGATPGSGMNDASGSSFNIGTTTVNYLAKDFAGNQVGCAFNVTYNDTTPLDPNVLYFHPNITLDCATDKVFVDLEVINYDSIRNMQFGIFWDTSVVQYVSHTNLLPPSPVYNTDSTGVGALGLVYFDFVSPAIGSSFPDNTVIIQFEFDLVGSFGIPLLNIGPFGPLALEITNASGRLMPGEYEFLPGTVNSSDTIPPVISDCPLDTVLYVGSGSCDISYTWTPPTVTDDCDGAPSVTSNRNPGDTFALGVDTVVYIATDDSGNSDTCSFVVTVLDTISPQVTCPSDRVKFSRTTVCGDTVQNISPVIIENCGIASTTYTFSGGIIGGGTGDASGRFFPADTTTVTYTVTDSSGNSGTCSFMVLIRDTIAPTITCPADITVSAEADSCSAFVNVPNPTINDLCGSNRTNDYNNSPTASDRYPVGVTTVVWTATDPSGNSASCSMTITVEDSQAPNLSCPNDTTIDITMGPGVVVNNIDATFSDNCDTNPGLTYRITGPSSGSGNGQVSGQTFNIGTNTVTYTVSDANGNVDSCSFDVIIRLVPNNIIDCPADVLINSDQGRCDAVVNNISASILINPADLASLTYSINNGPLMLFDASGQTFPVGFSIVEYFAEDNFGNRDSCTFRVTVVDNEAPAWANCPADITVFADTSCTAIANWTIPTASDNCTVASTSRTNDPGESFGIGTTTVSYFATDGAGLSDTCSFTITVLDTIAPVFVDCPTPDSLTYTLLSDCRAVVDWTPPSVIDCSAFNLTATHSPGDTFAPGNQVTVLYFAVDLVSGQSSTCSFVVNVQDDNPPSIKGCPGDTTIATTAGVCSAPYSWDESGITVSDDCGVPTISSNFSPGFNFPLGSTEVIYIATDISGNQDTCSFIVTVEDRELPVFSCDTIEVSLDGSIIRDPNNLLVAATPTMECDSLKLSFNPPSAEDNCSGTLPGTQIDMTGFGNGSSFPLGATTLSYEAADSSGNVANCDLTIIINDLPSPPVNFLPGTQVCEGTDVTLVTDMVAGATYSWTGPDNFSSPDFSPVVPSITSNKAGQYTVTVTLQNGCTAQGSNDISIDAAPIVTATSNSPACDGDLVLTPILDSNGAAAANWEWFNPSGQSISTDSVAVLPNATQSGNYIVIATSVNGCEGRDTTDVLVANLPAPSIQTDCDEVICLGDDCMLLGTQFAPPPDSYNWIASPQAGSGLGDPPFGNEVLIEPTEEGIYVYNYWVTKDGCNSDTATTVIQVVGLPIVVDDEFTVEFQQGLTFDVLENDTLANIPFTLEIVAGCFCY